MTGEQIPLEEIAALVEVWHDRSGLTYEDTRERMADTLGIYEYDRNTFYNKFRRTRDRNPHYQTDEVLALIHAYCHDLPPAKRCRPAEAIRLMHLTRRSLDAFSVPRDWFPQADYDAALQRYLAESDLTLHRSRARETDYLKPLYPRLFVGRHDDMMALKTRLGAPRRSTRQPVTIIRGWVGVGKSTLVNRLMHDDDVNAAFQDGILWTNLGEYGSSIAAMKQWGVQLGIDTLHYAATLEDVVHQLRRGLQDKEVLLVVDDIWREADGMPFKKLATKHTTLLMTTRFTDIARRMAIVPEDIYKLSPLCTDDAMLLMSMIAPAAVQHYRPTMKQLVDALGGLPLALRVAGALVEQELEWDEDIADLADTLATSNRLFNHKAPEDYFDEVHARTPTVECLFQRSVDTLSEEARLAFAYLGAFESKPATFSLDAVQYMWDSSTDEAIALIKALVQRGLLEPVGGGHFQMHEALSLYARHLLQCTTVPARQ